MTEIINEKKRDNTWMYILVGFASLGLLVGSIAGLSSAELTIPLFGFIFAFIGGSLMAFFGKIPKASIIYSCIALTSFSFFVIIALYIGLIIKVNKVLFFDSKMPKTDKELSKNTNSGNDSIQGNYEVLMRSDKQELAQYLTEEIRKGHISLLEACERLSETNK